MSWFFNNLVATFLLPPLSLILLGIAGLLLLKRYPRFGRRLVWLSLTLLYLLSTPLVAHGLRRTMEAPPLTAVDDNFPAQAIVVLGAGRRLAAPEYGADSVSEPGLERLRFAAHLQRLTDKPVLVTGGKPDGGTLSEARVMQGTLERDFHTPVRWLEERSNNTRENAQFSAAMLKAEKIDTIYLVTHGWHMVRAKAQFEAAGLQVIAAPTGLTGQGSLTLLAFLPRAQALEDSTQILHEVIGLVWYQFRK